MPHAKGIGLHCHKCHSMDDNVGLSFSRSTTLVHVEISGSSSNITTIGWIARTFGISSATCRSKTSEISQQLSIDRLP